MSQIVTRSGVSEEKEKRDSPVKDMKKKIAASAEKEKAVESGEKPADKGDKHTERHDKADKHDKQADKTGDKKAEKKSDTTTEKSKEDVHKGEKSAKEKNEKDGDKKPLENGNEVKESAKEVKENGNEVKENGKPHSGVTDVTLSNGAADDVLNGTAKVTRTPETPRPAGEKQPEKDSNTDDPKDGKVQKLKDDTPATDRKLRSADSPKPGDKKSLDKPQESAKKSKEKTPEPPKKSHDSPKKTQESPKKTPESPKKARHGSKDKDNHSKIEEDNSGIIEIDVEVVVDSDGSQDEREPRKLDTNYSKSRVKVSPYRRSMRLADQTASSLLANYTGNNTTMEMDITETSSFASATDEAAPEDSFLAGLRGIRGRRSYKPLKEMTLRHVPSNRSLRTQLNVSDLPSRPTGTVVGRKRKPDGEEEKGTLEGGLDEDLEGVVRSKRLRLLDRLAHPFKRTLASTPIPRRAAEIVGINTDLPLSAPLDTEPFDPESLKPVANVTEAIIISETVQSTDRDGKKCIVM